MTVVVGRIVFNEFNELRRTNAIDSMPLPVEWSFPDGDARRNSGEPIQIKDGNRGGLRLLERAVAMVGGLVAVDFLVVQSHNLRRGSGVERSAAQRTAVRVLRAALEAECSAFGHVLLVWLLRLLIV